MIKDNKGHFSYNGKLFIEGTIVKFKEKWLIDNGYSLYQNVNTVMGGIKYGKCLYGKLSYGHDILYFNVAKSEKSFDNPISIGHECGYDFSDSEEWKDYMCAKSTNTIKICKNDIEDAIEYIVSGVVYLVRDENEVYKPEFTLGWIIYIIIMFSSILFKQTIGLWLFFTLLWIFIRKIIINNYKDKEV